MNFWPKAKGDLAPGSMAGGGMASGIDIINAASESMRLVDNSTAAMDALTDGYEEWRRRFKAGTGQDAPPNPMLAGVAEDVMGAMGIIPNPLATLSAMQGKGQGVERARADFQRFINEQASRYPAEAVRDWAQFDAGQFAEGLARRADQNLARLMESRPGWDKYIASFAGAATGSLRDPITVGSLVFGGGPGGARTAVGRVLTAAGSEAGLNAATEAFAQPDVQAWRARVGLESGLDKALANIAFAGALGGFFGGGGRGLIEVLEGRAAGAAARAAMPPEMRGALDAAETIDLMGAQRPADFAPELYERMVARADMTAQGRAAPVDVLTDEAQVARLVEALSQPPDTAVGRLLDSPALDLPDLAVAQRAELFREDPSLGARFQETEGRFAAAEQRVAGIEQDLAQRTIADSLEQIDPVAAELLRAVEAEIETAPAARRAALEGKRDQIVESVGRAALEKMDSDYRIGPERELKSARKSLATARRERSAVTRAIEERMATQKAVREALRQAGGLAPDAVVRKAVALQAEGKDMATAVSHALSDAAGVSRVTPPQQHGFADAPEPPRGIDDPGAAIESGFNFAAELEALREFDPDLVKAVEAATRPDIEGAEKVAAMAQVVSACRL